MSGITATRLLALAVMAIFFWPQPADAAAWYSTPGWRYRKSITVHSAQVPNTDQSGFPVLINLATDSGLSAHAQTSGNDILFTSSDGITQIPYEREKYTSGAGALVAWVRVPTLSHTADTVLYMYYGNSGASDQQQKTSVWDSNYKLVYHLGDASSPALDSTSNGNNGTQSGGVTFGAAGQIDGATTYANSGSLNEYISAASQPLGSSSYLGSFTYHLWIRVTGSVTLASDTTSASGSYFLDRTAAQAGNPLLSLIAVSGSHWGYQTRYDDGTGIGGPSGGTLTSGGSGAWTHIEMVRDFANNLFRLYVNGAQVGTTASNSSKPLTPSTPKLGRHATFGSPCWLNGLIDEFRIQSVARSADWIKTEYNNESSPGGFYAVGSEEVASSRRRGLTIVGRLIPGGSVESASLGDYQNE